MKKDPNILVFGASGNIGGKTAEELLSLGASVGVIGRKAENLSHFVGRASIHAGNFEDNAFLRSVLQQADALFLTVPDAHLIDPALTARRLSALLSESPVTHLVNISNSIIEKNGAPTRLVAFEHELNRIVGVHIKHLRCANFFENLEWGLHTPYHPDLKLPYISSYEVGCRIADLLFYRNFEGKTVEVLLGPTDYAMSELAAAAGAAYQQLPYTPQNESFFRPFNEGNFKVEARTEANTSKLQQERFTLQYFLDRDYKAQEAV